MAPKVDSLNIVSNTKPLSVVSKLEINSKIEVFENKKTKANIDEIDLCNQNSNNQIEEKSDNKKKWLIAAGIALGTLAVGVASFVGWEKWNVPTSFNFVILYFNFSCRTVQNQKKNSRFKV